MKYIVDDIIEMGKKREIDVLVHGSNCHHIMDGGIALGIKKTFPEAYEADLKTVYGDKSKLGNYSFAECENGLIIVNAYTQFTAEPATDKETLEERYQAIREVLQKVKEDFGDKRIGLPYIGSGLAGGDVNVILPIFAEVLGNTDTTVVKFWKDV